MNIFLFSLRSTCSWKNRQVFLLSDKVREAQLGCNDAQSSLDLPVEHKAVTMTTKLWLLRHPQAHLMSRLLGGLAQKLLLQVVFKKSLKQQCIAKVIPGKQGFLYFPRQIRSNFSMLEQMTRNNSELNEEKCVERRLK